MSSVDLIRSLTDNFGLGSTAPATSTAPRPDKTGGKGRAPNPITGSPIGTPLSIETARPGGAPQPIRDTSTTPAAPNPAAPTLSEATAQAIIAALLSEYGLGGGALQQMLIDLMINGVTDPTLLRLYIEQSEDFANRFPALEMRRQQGLSKISAREYIDFENYAAGLFAEWGLPPTFYDERGDFTDWIASSPDLAVARQSLQQRVQGAFSVVAAAPQEIRDAFGTYFGARGDAALAAYVLDRDRSMPALMAQVEIAQVGGIGAQFGYDLDRGLATGLYDRGVREQQARSGFAQVQDLNPLFNETISEGSDYTAEGEGFSAVFRLDAGEAMDRLQRRVEQRRANFSGRGGFTQAQGGGLVGLGTGR